MTTQRPQGCSGDHTLRSGANAHQAMGARASKAAGDRGLHIAIGDGLNASASGADLGDQILVTGTIHHHDHQIRGGDAQALTEDLDVLCCTLANVDLALGGRGRSKLLHVEVGSIEQTAGLRGGEHSHGAPLAVGAKVGAFAGINREIHARTRATADFLADVEHRSFIALTLTDNDAALHIDLTHALAHGLNSRGVCFVLETFTGELSRCDGGLLDDLEDFLDERAIHSGWGKELECPAGLRRAKAAVTVSVLDL